VQPSLIRIDFQVHQYLENRRTNPTQTHNDILREIIGLSPSDVNEGEDAPLGLSRGWSGAGVNGPAAVHYAAGILTVCSHPRSSSSIGVCLSRTK
jgi:hypothetical protein